MWNDERWRWPLRWLIPVLVLSAGCRRVPEAPQELDALTHYLFRNWENDDPAVLEEGLKNLESTLSDQDLDPEVNLLDRAWELTSITEKDLADIDWPDDRNAGDTWGVAVGFRSSHPVEAHAGQQASDQQMPVEPSAASYTRDFPDEPDPECFVDASCEVLFTLNEITRENLLMSVGFTLHKDFRWVELGDDERAMLSRSYITESAEGENGKTTIWQSYNVEAWIPSGKGTLRYQVLWSEADVAGASDAIQIGTVKKSTNDHFEVTEEHLGG